MYQDQSLQHEKWLLRRLVLVSGLIASAAIILGGFYLLRGGQSGAPVSIEGDTGYVVVALICLICTLIWLMLTQVTRLHQSRENLRLTLQSSTDIVVILDAQARYVDIFATNGEQLVEDPEKSRGKTVRETLGNEIGVRVENLITEVLAPGEKRAMSYSLQLNGQPLWFEAVLSKRDKSTVVAMIRDVTREFALQKELEEQRRFMENILNAISDPIFMKDERHRWLYGNDAFSSMLGLTREQYYGKTDRDFQPEEVAEAYFSGDRETFESMKEIEREESFPAIEGGEVRTILTKKTPFAGLTGEKTLVGIIRDITDRKVMEKQLENERARQIGASRLASLGEMAGGVAHEINNPLAIISGYVGRLKDILVQEPIAKERAIEIVERIDNTTNRIATIVKGLRAISRDGGFDAKERVSIAAIVNDTLGLCSERFRNQGVEIYHQIDPNLFVQCRSVQISQVLLNLLTNAFFAVSKVQNGKISVIASRVEEVIEITVSDSGTGIDRKIRERIFEPFFTTKPVGVGTGLGLSIASSIVREHDGELLLDPDSPETKFVIRLPAHSIS